MKALSILGWYRILRGHYHWTIFQSIRYAVWLRATCVSYSESELR
jgi:hypothetical protein